VVADELKPEDFGIVGQAVVRAATTEAQVLQMVADLAREVNRESEVQDGELAERVREMQREVARRFALRAKECVDGLHQAADQWHQEQQDELERAAAEARQQALDEIRAQAKTRSETLHEAMLEATLDEAAECVVHLSEEFDRRWEKVLAPLDSLEQLVQGHRPQMSSTLASALHRWEHALARGQSSLTELVALKEAVGSSDSFVSRILTDVEVDYRANGPVPTRLHIQRRFDEEIQDCVKSVLTPAVSSNDYASHTTAKVTGWCLGHLYNVKAGLREGEPSWIAASVGSAATTAQALQSNLQALSRTADLVHAGDLRGALSTLDSSLTGSYRTRVEASLAAWMSEARRVVLVKQATDAIRAKERCLASELTE
jgi:hypothetical protein